MAERFEIFDIAVPAGTASSAPLTTATKYSDGTPLEVEIVFPSGCAGLVGVRLDYGAVTLVPMTAGAWIRGNDEVVKWPLEGYPAGGGWKITAYNTDVYTHTLQVRYALREIVRPPAAEVAIVPVDLAAVNEPVPA